MKNIHRGTFLGAIFNSNVAFAQTETSGRTVPYRATHTKTTELKHTKLKVNFDYQKEQMNGEEWLTASPFFLCYQRIGSDAKGMLIHEVALIKMVLSLL
jgi:aminopeptidase N